MFFTHKTVKDRINKIHSDIGKLTNAKYNNPLSREEAVKNIRFNLLALIKAEEKIAAQFKAVLKEMDDTYRVG